MRRRYFRSFLFRSPPRTTPQMLLELYPYTTTIGLNNPCKLLEKLFDSLILPISLYCCEIWGLESALKCKESDPYELLHTKFMKEILGSAL